MTAPPPLPPDVESALGELVAQAREALGQDLVSLALFGSAAEGRLRRVSDVNVLLVLRREEPAALARLRPVARSLRARIGLDLLVVLESELPEAAAAFAEKFGDLRARHRVLAGADVLSALEIPREALRARLAQSLLNLALRQRRVRLTLPSTEDQAAHAVGDLAGPLRACAHALLQLEGRPAPSPREALERVAADVPGAADALARLSEARERLSLPIPAAEAVLAALSVLTESMRHRARAVP